MSSQRIGDKDRSQTHSASVRYSWWLANVQLNSILYGARCSPVVKSVRSWCDGSSDRSLMVDPLSYFSFQPVLHDWCTKGRGMCYPVCGVMHIKEPLLLIGKSSLCGDSGFPLSLSDWFFTICLTPYNGKWNVLGVSLNKKDISFLFLSCTV